MPQDHETYHGHPPDAPADADASPRTGQTDRTDRPDDSRAVDPTADAAEASSADDAPDTPPAPRIAGPADLAEAESPPDSETVRRDRKQLRQARLRSMRLRKNVFWRMLHSLATLKGSPEAIARGWFIGLVIGMTPTYGLQMILSAVIASALKSSRPASLIPVWVTNPVTIPPVYAGTYWLGQHFWSGPPVREVYDRLVEAVKGLTQISWYSLADQFLTFWSIGVDVFVPMMIGGLISGVLLGLITYPIVLWGVRWVRAHLAHLHALRLAVARHSPVHLRRHEKDQPEPDSSDG